MCFIHKIIAAAYWIKWMTGTETLYDRLMTTNDNKMVCTTSSLRFIYSIVWEGIGMVH